MNKIALLFHVNFNHLSLSYRQRKEYIENYFEKTIDLITVPVTFSICCEDLLLLKCWNPKAFSKFVNHPHVKFVKSLYSHSIPQLFPNSHANQIDLANRIYFDLIQSSKLLNICYSAEVDLPPEVVRHRYDGLILGETKICINGLSQEKYPPVFYIDNGSSHKLIGYLSRRKFNFREYIHKLFRNEVDLDETINQIKNDCSTFASNSVLVARIDWEVIMLNQKHVNNKVTFLPFKIWGKFFSAMKSKNFKLYTIDQIEQNSQDIPIIRETDILSCGEENNKWSNTQMVEFINSFDITICSKEQLIVYYSLFCSDYYCSEFPNLIFPYLRDKTKEVVIHKNRLYRDQESATKLKMLTNNLDNTQLLSSIVDKDLQKYIYYFIKTINTSKKYL